MPAKPQPPVAGFILPLRGHVCTWIAAWFAGACGGPAACPWPDADWSEAAAWPAGFARGRASRPAP